MPTILGSDEHRYRVVENWAKLPDGWTLTDVASVAVDSKDRVYVFNRGAHPMIVFDRDGNFIKSWGEGLFHRAHGLHIDADDHIYCTDDGDHTVRKCTTDGKVLLTIGIPEKPAPFMSGEPFHRCTHTALSPKGEIYVSDGYGNARVHKYTPDGKLIKSWGEPGSDPGQFNIVHNISTDADGWVYVADRENHRVQVFDGNGKYEAQWNNLHRPCALHCCGGKSPNFIIGELGPGMPVNLKVPNLGPRLTIVDSKGKRVARLGGEHGPGLERRQVPRPARRGAGFKGRHLCRRGRRHQLEDQFWRHADAGGGQSRALPAEAGKSSIVGVSAADQRIAHHLAPPPFGFFGIAPHRMRLGQDSDRPLVAGFDHGERFSLGHIEGRDGLADIHAGMQDDAGIMQDAAQRLVGIDIPCMRVRYEHHAGIVTGVVDRDHLRLRARRKLDAKLGDRRRHVHREHIRPHQPPHGEIANPADVGGAADGFAAQVQPPGSKGIAEQFARDLGRDDDRHQHGRASARGRRSIPAR